MNQEDSVSKVEETKSEEELSQLLEKIEKNIIGSITKGIEIADSFSREDQNLTGADNSRAEGVKTPNLIWQKFVSAEIEKQRWEFLNPIVLYKTNWMGARTEGISLDKGTYKIQYQVTTSASKGSGLAVFSTDKKKVEKLLYWQLGVEGSSSITNESGTQHLAIKSPGIINITDISGNFNPKDVESTYIVTMFRVNTLPD